MEEPPRRRRGPRRSGRFGGPTSASQESAACGRMCVFHGGPGHPEGSSMKANNLRRGYIIKFEGDLWRVFEVEHQTPGNLRARVQTKIKNLRNGAMKDYRFRSEDEIEKAHLDQKDMQYMYRDGEDFHFMDT